jgi:hypothetical protein
MDAFSRRNASTLTRAAGISLVNMIDYNLWSIAYVFLPPGNSLRESL